MQSPEPSQYHDAQVNVLPVNVIVAQRSNEVYDVAVYFGTVKPSRSARLGFAVGGQVAVVEKRVGEEVAQGERVASLDLANLQQEKADLEQRLRAAREELTQRSAEPRTAASQQAVGRLNNETAALENGLTEVESQLQGRIIVAPFAGVVAELDVHLGDMIPGGRPVLRVVNVSNPLIELEVDSRFGQQLQVGQQAWVSSVDGMIPAVVRSLSPVVSRFSHAQPVTLSIDREGANSPWIMQDTVEVRIWRQTDQNGFWLPLTALRRDAAGLWVAFVVQQVEQAATIQRRVVEVIRLQQSHALVAGSLNEGDLVVADGLNRIVPGQFVEANVVEDDYEQPGPPGASE